MWKLTRPDNRHDKLTRDNLLDLEDHCLVRIESVREDQRQVWVLTRRGHGEAKKLLEPKGIRIPALREEKYAPDTGQMLGAGYDGHSAAVTSTAAELHGRAQGGPGSEAALLSDEHVAYSNARSPALVGWVAFGRRLSAVERRNP
ncbi:hypothetical protein [Streptomyces roseolilacinus]|uniref:hypothetical protein n=1 Tax=Streptomyces roseolilacinus TaxID=66904 RepID=UPI0038286A67